MPERIFDVYIEGYVWPDKVDVYLHNDECADARSYVSEDLYESVSAANDAWHAENAKLRELVKNALDYISYDGCGVDNPYEGFASKWCEDCRHFDSSTCAYVIAQTAKELGIEVGA